MSRTRWIRSHRTGDGQYGNKNQAFNRDGGRVTSSKPEGLHNLKRGKKGLYYQMTHQKGDRNIYGFSSAGEYMDYPLRQIFTHNHGKMGEEWNCTYFTNEFGQKFFKENKKYLLSCQYGDDYKTIETALFRLDTKKPMYIMLSSMCDGDKNVFFALTCIFYRLDNEVKKWINYFVKHRVSISEDTKTTGKLFVISQNAHSYGKSYDLKNFDINKPNIDIDINYNEDFKAIHETIVDGLNKPNEKGLVLLHGIPGTGKTTYIRYLIHVLKKKIIYLPPNMSSMISEPSMVEFFSSHSNCILIIEDAENILMKRVKHSSQATANLLNLTDGLLSDCMNIQVIATFNSDLNEIDEALLRKGRLLAKYEFKELSADRVKKLCKKMHIKYSGSGTLAEIYNSEGMNFSTKKRPIGFKPKN